MDYVSRKNILKYRIINDNQCVSEVLQLVDDVAFEKIICNIDEESFYYNIEKKGKLSAKKFIELLNNYVEHFKGIFTNLKNYAFELKSSIIYCDALIEKYFSNKTNESNQDDYVYKIIFHNIIDNVKYVPKLKAFFKENKILIKM